MKTMNKVCTPVASLTLLGSLAGGVMAQTITNGSFEDVSGLTAVTEAYGIAYNGVPNGWEFSGTNVQVLPYSFSSGSPTAAAGGLAHYVEAWGESDIGTLSQLVDGFNVGDSYRLTFDWGGRTPFYSGEVYDFTVSIAGISKNYSGLSTQEGMYTDHIDFQATAQNETVAITWNATPSLPIGGSQQIGLIDNFRLEAVPEPSSALLLGIASLGLVARRRK